MEATVANGGDGYVCVKKMGNTFIMQPRRQINDNQTALIFHLMHVLNNFEQVMQRIKA